MKFLLATGPWRLRVTIGLRALGLVIATAGVASIAAPQRAGKSITEPHVGTIRIERVLTIGEGSGESALICSYRGFVPLARDTRGRFYTTGCDCGSVHVYSAEGRFERTVGKCGQGPEELQQVTALAADEHLYVGGDPVRILEYDSDLEFVGQFSLPRRFYRIDALPSRGVLINYVMSDRAAEDVILRAHVHDQSPIPSASVARYVLEGGRGEISAVSRLATAISPDGELWIAQVFRTYQIESWTREGTQSDIIRRNAEWFPDYSGRWDVSKPLILPYGLSWQHGLLFVLGQVPVDKGGEGRAAGSSAPARVRNVLEAIDTEGEVLVGRAYTTMTFFGFVDTFLYRPRDTADGVVVLDVFRVVVDDSVTRLR